MCDDDEEEYNDGQSRFGDGTAMSDILSAIVSCRLRRGLFSEMMVLDDEHRKVQRRFGLGSGEKGSGFFDGGDTSLQRASVRGWLSDLSRLEWYCNYFMPPIMQGTYNLQLNPKP